MVNLHAKIVHENTVIANAAAIVLQGIAQQSGALLFIFTIFAHTHLSEPSNLVGTWLARLSHPFFLNAWHSKKLITITHRGSWQVPISHILTATSIVSLGHSSSDPILAACLKVISTDCELRYNGIQCLSSLVHYSM
jgi:hypothetical protein